MTLTKIARTRGWQTRHLVGNGYFDRTGIAATIRLHASNALNHFNMETAKFVIDPSNPAFGTLNQGTVPTSDAPGRNLNVQFRVAF